MYFARALSEQNLDFSIAAFFTPIANELELKKILSRAEFNSAQGVKVDLGGYYKFDDNKAENIMRPSKSFNAVIERIAKK